MSDTWHELPWDARLKETLEKIADPGLLLLTGKDPQCNIMTIGWGSLGRIWGLPVFQVLVRPSRYTHKLLAQHGEFTVNVMPESEDDAVAYCGAASGRDVNKFQQMNLTTTPGQHTRTPILTQATLAYECRVLLTAEVSADKLDATVMRGSYASGDYHTMYFGQILALRNREISA